MCFLCFIATCLQAGQVVANVEFVDWNNRADNGCPRQPMLCSCNHHLHLCRYGNAAVWTAVWFLLREGKHARMELPGLPAFIHDHIPSAVWRVDRFHVELHSCQRRLHLHSVLSAHDDHWKSCCKYWNNFLFKHILIALGANLHVQYGVRLVQLDNASASLWIVYVFFIVPGFLCQGYWFIAYVLF